MSRYIDADKVLSKLCLDHKDVIYIDKEAVAKRIKALPHIDIVRCEECKWRDHFGCALKIVDESDKPKDDDFCSYGERSE